VVTISPAKLKGFETTSKIQANLLPNGNFTNIRCNMVTEPAQIQHQQYNHHNQINAAPKQIHQSIPQQAQNIIGSRILSPSLVHQPQLAVSSYIPTQNANQHQQY
jgi:hypothetical protein